MKDLRTIILAAGKGTRMKSDVPKVLHPICGQSVIQYVFDVVKYVGSLKTCLVLGHKHQLIEESLNENFEVAIQSKLLGTADAVRCAERYFTNYRGDILILCGDTPLLRKQTVKSLVKKHKKSKAACTFLTAVVHQPQGYGRVIRGDQGVVLAIREEKDASEFEKNIAEINAGVYCFKSQELFKALKKIKLNKKKKEFYLTDIIELLVDEGMPVETQETDHPEEGLGVNDREDLASANSIIRQRILKSYMSDGVTIVDPQTTFIDIDVKIGRDTIVRPFSIIENTVRIGSQCIIGPFARLRSGTKVGNHVEIGNFTEVSRTQIGNETLMKHFSFLGDAKVGAKVNIGAGVVTANYDGREKNTTHISDQAFIGSDSILVAPTRVGKKAVTAAGCVLTKGKNVPDNGIAVGVPGKLTKRRDS